MQIHEHDVWMKGRRQSDCLAAVSGTAHDLQPLVELQGEGQRLGEQVVVVGDQNAKATRVPAWLRP